MVVFCARTGFLDTGYSRCTFQAVVRSPCVCPPCPSALSILCVVSREITSFLFCFKPALLGSPLISTRARTRGHTHTRAQHHTPTGPSCVLYLLPTKIPQRARLVPTVWTPTSGKKARGMMPPRPGALSPSPLLRRGLLPLLLLLLLSLVLQGACSSSNSGSV